MIAASRPQTALGRGGRATRLKALTRTLLEELGEEPDREGLKDTPARVAEMLTFLTAGYRESPAKVVDHALFEQEYDELVVVRDIDFYSLCEHHLLPFFGRAHIGYLPNGRVIGLSKLARLVNVFARRLQLQERMTRQLGESIAALLQPRGVGVVLEAEHLCMSMRGVQRPGALTMTSAMLGSLRTDRALRTDFFSLLHPRS